MSRRRYDEEDYRDGPPRTNTGLWIGLGAAVVLGAVGLVVLIGLMFWIRPAPPPPPATAAPVVAGPAKGAMQKTYTRDEFKKLVMGKTMEEVKALLGAPDRTRDAAGGVVRWHYNQRTVDPANGKPDILAEVNFDKDGVVGSVNF
jgi:hypothetical protein